MTDLNKLRSEFEIAMKSKHILDLDFVQFHELSNKYLIQNGLSGEDFRTALDASHVVNVAWLMFQEKAKAQAVPEWISVEVQMPESLRNVLVLLDANPAKNQNQMVAHFIPKFTEEYHGDNDWYDYDEDRGCGYVKEGWYANTAYIGDEYSSYFIEEKVTHWKPLKEASESGAEQ